MAKKKNHNEIYWEAKSQEAVKQEYTDFLKKEGQEKSPDTAHLFAIRKTLEWGGKYRGMNERQLIIFLAGELPPMYD